MKQTPRTRHPRNVDSITAEPCLVYGTNHLVRTRFFDSMPLDAPDLEVAQMNAVHGLRILAQSAMDAGTLGGLKVTDTGCKWEVAIECGSALDCMGRWIGVPRRVTLNLWKAAERKFQRSVEEEIARIGVPSTQEPQPDPKDETCWPHRITLWVGICYWEQKERPLQSMGGPETCCQPTCEHSRVRHGFCVYATDRKPERPPSILDAMTKCKGGSFREQVCDWILNRECRFPPDPCEKEHHCLTLAEVKIRKNGEVETPDNCTWRSLALPTSLIGELLLHNLKG